MKWSIAVLLLLVLMAAGVWQLVDPFVPLAPAFVGVMLLVLGLLAGLRIGTESVGRFNKDLMRHSKLLADQNRDLVELNQNLLHPPPSPESTDAPHPSHGTQRTRP